jgi:hypothetical protein
MSEVEVVFEDSWSVEQRKAAINQALEEHTAFEIKSISIISEADEEESTYTGGFMQMATASGARLQIIKKQMSIQQL